MGSITKLFDPSTAFDVFKTGQKESLAGVALGAPLVGNIIGAKKAIGEAKRQVTPPLLKPIAMPDPQQIALEQKKLAARNAAGAGGRQSTILTGQQPDNGDRLGP